MCPYLITIRRNYGVSVGGTQVEEEVAKRVAARRAALNADAEALYPDPFQVLTATPFCTRISAERAENRLNVRRVCEKLPRTRKRRPCTSTPFRCSSSSVE